MGGAMMRLVLSFLMVAAIASAQTITGVVGEVKMDSTLTITGTFDAKPAAAPIVYDDFDDETAGTQMDGTTWTIQGIANRIPWYMDDSDYDPNTDGDITGPQRYTGDITVLQSFYSADPGGSNRSVGLSGLNTRQLYISFWVYRHDHSSLVSSCTNAKASGNFWTSPALSPGYDLRWDEYPDLDSGHVYAHYWCESDPYDEQHDNGTDSLILDTIGGWHRIERMADIGSVGGSDGFHAAYVDGAAIVEYSGQMTPTGCATHYDLGGFQIGHFFAEGEMYQFISEIYADSSFARVEIGDAATWSGCTQREIQIPTSWSTSAIEVVANVGSFDAGDTVYAYVVDADRSVSDAYGPLIVGEEDAVLAISAATRTGGNAAISWSAVGADSYQVQVDASGVTIYHATTTGTTITIPDVDTGALDVTVWPITSGVQGTPARTQIAAQ